jgi:hypothetical protein
MGKTTCGHPAVPLSRRCMLLVRYDLFPHMLVSRGHKLPDGTYRWVSSFDAGHQCFGTWAARCGSILAILSVEKGERVKGELNRLEVQYNVARKALEGGFFDLRATLLVAHKIKTRQKC